MNNKRQILLEIIPTVSRETEKDLVRYEALVRKWQSHINLIANATIPELWTRHILDSVQLFPFQSDKKSWLDIGSGGGFPGIVIAILLKTTGGHIDLIESNNKKAAFLRTVIAELELPAVVHCFRIENMVDKIKMPDVITARAIAGLNTLFELIKPYMGKKTVALLQKGRDYEKEIEEASKHWRFNLLKHKSKIDYESVILEINSLCKGVEE